MNWFIPQPFTHGAVSDYEAPETAAKTGVNSRE